MNEEIRILIDELCNIFSLYQTGPILCIKPFLCKKIHAHRLVPQQQQSPFLFINFLSNQK
jgi:hypothetical protein